MKTKFNGILTLLLAFVVQLTFAQEKTISGTVVDETNMPLPGATVVIKGTTTGASTDFDGKYTIDANTGDVLTFSYVGYSEQDITVGAESTVDISLTLDQSLEAVVITALGIKRKPDEITTANEVVKAEKLTQAKNPDVVQGLAGKVAGLTITTTSTGLTPDTDIQLRGTRSVTGDNGALIVIDGAIASASLLSDLDPESIESINVMKGPNGSALYGQQGANGVMVVTTKKGSGNADKFTVRVSSSVAFEEVAFLPETQDRFGQGYQGLLDVTDQGSWGPEYDGLLHPSGIDYPNVGDYRYNVYSHNEDNIKEFFNTGVTYQNGISLSSGNVKTGYVNFSAQKQTTEGLVPDDSFHKEYFSVRTGKTTGKWTVNSNATYTTDKTDRAGANLYDQLSQTPGNVNIGLYNSGNNEDHWTLYADSPYWILKNQRVENETNRFNGTIDLLYQINDNISAKLLGNVNFFNANYTAHTNAFNDNRQLDGDRSIIAYYETQSQNSRNLYNDFMLNFDYDLTEKLSFKANVGTNLTERRSTRVNIQGEGLLIGGLYNSSNIINTPVLADRKFLYRSHSVFANVDLAYNDYLFLNMTARNDWTSVLNPETRSAFYPSIGASFIPTKAFPSIKGKVLRKAKLSGGWVKVGNSSSVDEYQINNLVFQPVGFPLNNNSFAAASQTANPNLKIEFGTTTELNMNLEFFKGSRLTFDASVYGTKTQDQIINISPSTASGALSSLVNIGETKTDGFELELGFIPVDTDNFTWTNKVGYTTYDTVTEKVSDEQNSLEIRNDNYTNIGLFAEEGESFPLIKGTAYVRDGAGRVMLDANGNPVQSSEYKILGKTTPDYIINYNTTFKYKNLTLGATLDYRTGHQYYSDIANQYAFTGMSIESAEGGREAFLFPNSVVETSAGSGTFVANTNVLTGGNSAASFQNYFADNYRSFAENFVYDATALKLREVSLNYSLPAKMLEKLPLNKVTLGVSGRNLFMYLPKENRYGDPELGNGLGTFDFTPSTRTYTFSVNLTF